MGFAVERDGLCLNLWMVVGKGHMNTPFAQSRGGFGEADAHWPSKVHGALGSVVFRKMGGLP